MYICISIYQFLPKSELRSLATQAWHSYRGAPNTFRNALDQIARLSYRGQIRRNCLDSYLRSVNLVEGR